MAEIVANCPRCGTKHITFLVKAAHDYRIEHGWQHWYEVFGLCRHCSRTTIFVVSENVNSNYKHVHQVGLLKVEGSLNNYVDVKGHVSLKDAAFIEPPEYLPAHRVGFSPPGSGEGGGLKPTLYAEWGASCAS